MGEVYRAEDTKLGREVAIKVLPEAFTQNPERLGRFEREAKVLAALNHPHIAGIYEVGEETIPISADGGEAEGRVEERTVHFLVMELVEGDTLAERIAQNPLRLEESLPLALQIAQALEVAHDQGIIHRDLKPANIKVTPDERVKVLDFGLAKALEGSPDDANPILTQSPTLTAQMTGVGVLLGTAAYMSPEQARGEEVDRRADIWAFGVVLMEMLTGRSVYSGRTVSDTLAGVLAREPEWDHLPVKTPAVIRRLLERCLAKDVADRLQAIGEARIALAGYLADPEAAEEEVQSAIVESLPAWKRALPWVSLGLAVVAGVVAALGWLRTPSLAETDIMRLRVEVPGEGPILAPIGSSVVLSPDGRRLAYVLGNRGARNLYVRSLDRLEGTLVSGSEHAYNPFFSPDGEWLAFVTPKELKKVSVSGGTPLTLAEVDFSRGGSWGPDGTIIYAPSQESGLVRIPASGGEPEELTTLDEEKGEVTHRWPEILPGGRAVLFVSHTENARFQDGVIEALDLETGQRKVLVRGGTYPRYARSGHLVYVREGTLYALPFDPAALEVRGSPAPLVEEIETNELAYGSAHYSLSTAGKLVYLTDLASSSYSAVWVDREGAASPLLSNPGNYWQPRLSPQGERLALATFTGGSSDIWVHDLEREIGTRLTFSEADDGAPVWSPDGTEIVFSSDRGDSYDLFRLAADGSGEPERITESETDQFVTDWSSDGRFVIYGEETPESDFDIWVRPMDGSGEAEIFLGTPFIEGGAAFSPDGRWVAYHSNESGSNQIYVRPFPAGRGEWQISSDGGFHPVWTNQGLEIVFRTGSGLAAASIEVVGSSIRAGKPEILFEGQFVDLFPARDFHAAPDGKTFVFFQGEQTERDGNHLILVTHWFEALRQTFAGPGR